jgi:hypothetical protein
VGLKQLVFFAGHNRHEENHTSQRWTMFCLQVKKRGRKKLFLEEKEIRTRLLVVSVILPLVEWHR